MLSRGVVALGAVALALSGCGGSSAPPEDPGSISGSRSGSTSAARQPCPNPEGQACLGPIASGTYTTRIFLHPPITYSVPAGWSNFEDTPGNFLLVPPGGDLAGIDAGTSDYVGIYSTVAAPNGCESGTLPGVGSTAAEMAEWLAGNPGLVVSRRENVEIGGLSGFSLDLQMTPGWTQSCSYSNGRPLVPLLIGVDRSALEHAVVDRGKTRVYLLDNDGGALAVEVYDVDDDGRDLDTYSAVVEDMSFLP